MYFPAPASLFLSYFFKKEKTRRETEGDSGRQRGERFINLCVSKDMAQMGQNVAAEAAGASGGAWQQKPPVCKKVEQLISNMRSDIILAVRMDEFISWLNRSLQLDAEERGEVAVKASAEDVKECIRYDTTVKVVKTKDAEVLWLWEAWYYYELIDKIADMARRYRSVIADPESDEYDDDCGMLGCDKGDDDAQMEYLEG